MFLPRTFKWMYQHLAKPLLFRMHPDYAHSLFITIGSHIQATKLGKFLTHSLFSYTNELPLGQTIHYIYFPNPIGLSAGFDKDGHLYDLMADVGFGFTQVGSLTNFAYEGNVPPRSWRLLQSQGLVVNYGLKNEGVDNIIPRLSKKKERYAIPVSISVAKTNCATTIPEEAGITDYVECLMRLEAADVGSMYTINVSCPNTFGGEPFTTADRLDKLLSAIDTLHIQKPLFLKLPIELPWDEYQALLDTIMTHNIQGVILGNLKKIRDETILEKDIDQYKGGISGLPMQAIVRELVSKTYAYAGDKLTIIGVGGVFSAEDAYELIKRGASLVQLITGMIFKGPQLIGQINKGLTKLLEQDGYTNISEAVGAYHKE